MYELGKYVLPWMGFPPDPGIDYVDWLSFRDGVSGWILGCVLSAAFLIWIAYCIHSRLKKIRGPRDLYGSYTPMMWLWLSIVPGIVVFIIYWKSFVREFPGSPVSYASGAVTSSLWAMLGTLAIGYLLIWLPWSTPAKFRYRPTGWFRRNKKAARAT